MGTTGATQTVGGNGTVDVLIDENGASDLLRVVDVGANCGGPGNFRFGSVNLAADYVSSDVTFTGNNGNQSMLAWSPTARTLTITLGARERPVDERPRLRADLHAGRRPHRSCGQHDRRDAVHRAHDFPLLGHALPGAPDTLAGVTGAIRKNTILLAACLVTLSGTVQLVVAVSTVTLVLVTGVEGILGLGPAIFLTAAALASLPAGRLMDRFGRVPVIAGGFVVGALGCGLTALGCAVESGMPVGIGFALVGIASGTILLARAAGADMYPPERRARGISYVLSGSLFGAALGPLVFRPLFAGKELDADALVVPWLVGGAIMLVGVVIVAFVRPDPQKIAYALRGPSATTDAPAAPLTELVRREGVPTALLAAFVSFGVMVSVMNLTGYLMLDNGHHQTDVFTVISVHIVGMYAFVLVVGPLVDRIGRRQCEIGGLAVMALSTLVLVWAESIAGFSLSLFLLGLGWNFSYVAAASELANQTAPHERGRLLGFSDLISGLLGASLALAGGVVYTHYGKPTLALAATAIALAPVVWITLAHRRPPAEVLEPVG